VALWVWLVAGLAGGSGALARFLLDVAISERSAGEFPWGTFTINISGSFLLGVFVGGCLAGNALLLAGTASVGSYTTFSTWMFEAHRLGEDDDRRPLALYVVGSLAAGLGAAACGRILGRAL
jgi:fluoride exporter